MSATCACACYPPTCWRLGYACAQLPGDTRSVVTCLFFYDMEWDDEKYLTLINLYHEKEVLWNPKHPDHKSRPKRFDSLNEIANHFKTNVSEIERKIKNLTSQYYRERKKVTDSKKSGIGTDCVYQSKWFAYKSFSFLQNKNTPTAMIDSETSNESSVVQPQQNDSSHSFADDTIKRPRKNLNNEMMSQALCAVFGVLFNRDLPVVGRVQLMIDEKVADFSLIDGDSGIINTLNIMKSVSDRQNQTQEKDEETLFGEYIAAKLRKMDKSTNAIVKHRINNIIFETEIGYQTDMYADYARPSSSRSHPGYYTGSPNDQPNAYPSNSSSSVYSTITSPDHQHSTTTNPYNQPNTNPSSEYPINISPHPQLPGVESSVPVALDESSNSERISSQDIQNVFKSINEN
ncbi:uncharacterized protein LOC128679819 [Plodia interpunctella]|uniref:uncharacterized protein LOC128679819 n=1 Tax=Plodia interpunctella TaxID=58824 RepID=UPI0023686664|nr:uncharacterized protein LOC128679819 [Plodia interpunctella]